MWPQVLPRSCQHGGVQLGVMGAEQRMKSGVCVTQRPGRVGSIRVVFQGLRRVGRVQRQDPQMNKLGCHIVHFDGVRLQENVWNQ